MTSLTSLSQLINARARNRSTTTRPKFETFRKRNGRTYANARAQTIAQDDISDETVSTTSHTARSNANFDRLLTKYKEITNPSRRNTRDHNLVETYELALAGAFEDSKPRVDDDDLLSDDVKLHSFSKQPRLLQTWEKEAIDSLSSKLFEDQDSQKIAQGYLTEKLTNAENGDFEFKKDLIEKFPEVGDYNNFMAKQKKYNNFLKTENKITSEIQKKIRCHNLTGQFSDNEKALISSIDEITPAQPNVNQYLNIPREATPFDTNVHSRLPWEMFSHIDSHLSPEVIFNQERPNPNDRRLTIHEFSH